MKQAGQHNQPDLRIFPAGTAGPDQRGLPGDHRHRDYGVRYHRIGSGGDEAGRIRFSTQTVHTGGIPADFQEPGIQRTLDMLVPV